MGDNVPTAAKRGVSPPPSHGTFPRRRLYAGLRPVLVPIRPDCPRRAPHTARPPSFARSDMTHPHPADDAGELESVLFEVKKVIVGQDRVVERLLVSLL